MKKVIAVLTVLAILLTGCTDKSGTEAAAYGVGRKLDSTEKSW
jgi:hypothetical protein